MDLCVVSHFSVCYAMNEFSDFKDNLKLKDVSIFKWIKQFKSSECTFYYNRNDNKPFWNTLLHKLHLK